MLNKQEIKKNFKENKRAYMTAGILVGFGILIGVKVQRRVDMKLFKQSLEGTSILRKAANPMFPDSMPISEIKEVLRHIEGAEFFDALVTRVNGAQSLIIRV